MPNIFQQLSAQIRSLKTENEQLKKNGNGATKKTYIKELFQMTIKNMKLTKTLGLFREAKTNLDNIIEQYEHHVDNRILDMEETIAEKEDEFLEIVQRKTRIIEEQRKKIEKYEEQMKSLFNMINDAPPTYQSVVNNSTNNPIKIQSLVRGYLIRIQELLKCGVCYETKCECKKVKTKCCNQIICKKCFERINNGVNPFQNKRCPFCRNVEDFQNSIPFEWFNIIVERGHRIDYTIQAFRRGGAFNGGICFHNSHPDNIPFNIPYENIPTQWKCRVGEWGWYGKYMKFAENMAIQQDNRDYINYTPDTIYRMTYPLENNYPLTRMSYKSPNTVIIEGNSYGIFQAFQQVFKTPSHLTLSNPNNENLIEIPFQHCGINNPDYFKYNPLIGIGKSSGFDLQWYIAEIEENLNFERDDFKMRILTDHFFTEQNTKGQTKDAKWNRAFLRVLKHATYEMEDEGFNYNAIYFTLKYKTKVYVFVINIQEDQQNPREYTYYNSKTLVNSFKNNQSIPL